MWFNEGTARTVYVKHKTAHALGGLGLVFACYVMNDLMLGVALAWIVGVSKELLDKNMGGAFRIGDVLWTGAPATLLAIYLYWR